MPTSYLKGQHKITYTQENKALACTTHFYKHNSIQWTQSVATIH